MALSQSVASELLEAFRAGEGGPRSNSSGPVTSAAPATSTASATPTTTRFSSSAPTTQTSALELARKLETKIPAVSKVVKITEDNDPNNLIGRPNGYTSAAVVFDRRVNCSDGLGADCGATVEVWASPAAAKRRASYIEDLQQASPILGTEYHTIVGSALLRVAGDIKPSQAKKYAAAFTD